MIRLYKGGKFILGQGYAKAYLVTVEISHNLLDFCILICKREAYKHKNKWDKVEDEQYKIFSDKN